ncbi:hypothetical protein ACQ0P8_01610 [Halodesulfovibrio aestuarii]|uniref:Uncharacterized protein n=1 Tax=Halodesulfovibrio aestuarii TaxID=126333 RepID=A0A8G2FGL4_9BACT|nr:hypothetical protein [Halodesulfovibrio aestuarii]SHI57458.1 hypothetical protein SAMN05660830_00350 [Halodesulfovibrio aestuarii]
MVSKRMLASVCMAALLIGTQAAAENAGVDSVADNVSSTTATSAVKMGSTEATQIQLIEQAIREVEAEVQHDKKKMHEASGNSPVTLSKEASTLQYEAQQPVQTARNEQSTGGHVVSAVPPLYQGGTEISAEVPNSPLFPKDDLELEKVTPYEPGYIQEYEHGVINWLTGTVTAKGESLFSGLAVSSRQARLKTVRAATIEARKNLLEILSKIPVTENVRVQNILHADEDVMQFVRGDMQNSRITSATFTTDGVATVTVSITLRGMFLEKLLGNHVLFHRVSDNPYSAANAVAESIEKAVLSKSQDEAPEVDAALPTAYTGLLIDARELGISPAITFTVADEEGHILYSPRVVNRDVALKNGMVEYAGTWEEAIASKRTSSNPLVLKAVSVQGKMHSNIVISDEQALLLKQINNAHKFLEEGRVVVVCK